MARLDLSDKEQLAMLYVLVKQVSQEDLSNLVPKYGRSSPSFAAFAKLVSMDGHREETFSCNVQLCYTVTPRAEEGLMTCFSMVWPFCLYVSVLIQCRIVGSIQSFPVSVCGGMLFVVSSSFASGEATAYISNQLPIHIV